MNSLYRLNRYCGETVGLVLLKYHVCQQHPVYPFAIHSVSVPHEYSFSRLTETASMQSFLLETSDLLCNDLLAHLSFSVCKMGRSAVLEAVKAFVLKHCPSYRLSAFSIIIFPSHSPQSLPCHSEASSQHFYACCYSTCKSIYSNCIFLQFQAATLLSHLCRQSPDIKSPQMQSQVSTSLKHPQQFACPKTMSQKLFFLKLI